MRKIFITYRRADDEFAAGALGRELRRHFGDEQIFRDKENIGGGVSWKQQLLHEIDRDSALLVLIGRDWADVRDSQGRRRLDNPADGLRLEIADGIKDGAAIIPVLLENARMPDEVDLPPDVKPLAEFNALKLRDGDWHRDVEAICLTLERIGFEPLAAARQIPQPAQPVRGPVSSGPTSLKAIVGGTLVILAAVTLVLGDLDRSEYLGVAGAFLVALVLGFVAWREAGTHDVGRILGPVVATVAMFGLVAGLRGYLGAGPEDPGELERGRIASDDPRDPGAAPPTGTPTTGLDGPTQRLAEKTAATITGDLPAAQSILDRHVEAIGGRSALLGHTSRTAKGTLTISGMTGPVEWYTAKPNKVLFKVSLPGMGDGSEGFDGTHGWKSMPVIGPVLLAGKELEDKRLESDFYGELTHEHRYASMTVVEQTQFEGRPCIKVRLVRKSGEEEFEFYDLENGLMAGNIRPYESPTGRMARTTVLSDYRRFGDLRHPTTLRIQGLMLQVIAISSIEYDQVPPRIFDLPAGLAAQVK